MKPLSKRWKVVIGIGIIKSTAAIFSLERAADSSKSMKSFFSQRCELNLKSSKILRKLPSKQTAAAARSKNGRFLPEQSSHSRLVLPPEEIGFAQIAQPSWGMKGRLFRQFAHIYLSNLSTCEEQISQ